eukprot:5439577-Pyramimonas_sp.AAC.1
MDELLLPTLRLCVLTNDEIPEVIRSLRTMAVRLSAGYVDVRMSKCAEQVAKAKPATRKVKAKQKAGKLDDKDMASTPL